MAKKESQPKLILEREYLVPLRKEWLKVPIYKRSKKAIKALKEFMVRHMKIYDRDLKKIKIDVDLNNELIFRGVRKPLSKIKVKARKFDNDIVRVELINIPKHIKFQKEREQKIKEKNVKKEEKEIKNDNKNIENGKLKNEEKIDEKTNEEEDDKKINEEEKEKNLDNTSEKDNNTKVKKSKNKNIGKVKKE
ncbi:MAG: hypothetical protein AABW83_01635 [Nanoarchaeota archaeon]